MNLRTLALGRIGAALLLLSSPAARATGSTGTTAVNFTLATVDATGPSNPWTKIAGDLDGDGRPDLIVAGQKGPLVWYRSPDWAKHKIADGGWETVSGAVGDVDDDGDLDVLMGGTVWFENPGYLKSKPGQSWQRHRIGDDPTHDIAVADFNGDGRLDAVTRNQSEFGAKAGNKIRVWLQQGGQEWQGFVLDCPHGEGLAIGDLDRDGDPDIVIGSAWFETIRSQKAVRWQAHSFADWHPNATVAVADLNGDGRLDVALAPSELAKQAGRVSWFEAPEDPRSGAWRENIVAEPVEAVMHSLAAADVNLDGQIDLAFAEMHQGSDPDEVGVFLNSGRGAAWRKEIVSNAGSHGLQVADFDGDGDVDLFGANWSGPFQPVQLWENRTRPGTQSALSARAEPEQQSPNWVRLQFREVDTLFANPGQGWMSQQRSPTREPRFPCSVVYIRFNWTDAEPERGQYNWKIIDDVIEAWKSRGATVAFRIMTCNAHSAGYYASPKWLFDSGAKGFEYVRGGDDPTSGGKRIPRIEPDYSDPLYLARHGEFLAALGQRYDGHSHIEFLDIGSYGIWGEWHTPNPAPVAVRQQIVDLYLQAFRKTPLVFMSDDAEVLPYALAHGTGFRRDGVGSPWHEEHWIGSRKYAGVPDMAGVWRRAPVVFEWFGNYDYLNSRGWSFDAAVQFMLRNHLTLLNDNIGPVPPEAIPPLQQLARLAGARFVLRELTHPSTAPRGSTLPLKMKWANVGVGKLYRPYVLRVSVLDAKGQAVVTTDAPVDLRDWLPGDHDLEVSLLLPQAMGPGEHTIAIAVVDPIGLRRPFQLAFDAPLTTDGYQVSQVILD